MERRTFLRGLAVTGAVGATGSLPRLVGGVQAATATLPESRISPVEPTYAAGWESLFRRVDKAPGWIQGDGAYSALLPDAPGRPLVFSFGDTAIGTIQLLPDGTEDRASQVPVRSSMVATSSSASPSPDLFTTFHGGTAAEPGPQIPLHDADPPDAFYYTGALGLDRASGKVCVFARLHRVGPDPVDPEKTAFAYTGTTRIARFEPTTMRFHSWSDVPTIPDARNQWGSAVIRHEGYWYIYGEVHDGFGRNSYLARAWNLDGANWQFWAGDGWSGRPEDAAVLDRNIAVYGVQRVWDKFVFLHAHDFGRRMFAFVADKPEGPMSGPYYVYDIPERQPGSDLWAYIPIIHPVTRGTGTASQTLVSYSVNRSDYAPKLTWDEFVREARLTYYRPRFTWVNLYEIAAKRGPVIEPDGWVY